MKTQQQKIGEKGENLAIKYFKKHHYQIIERHFVAGRFGEIDIVAQDKDKGELVFVEVKTKTDEQFGLPEEEFTYQKRKKFYRAIQNYLFKKYFLDKNWRVDFIAIEILDSKPILRHYQNIPLP